MLVSIRLLALGLGLAVLASVATTGCLRKPPGVDHPSAESTRAALEEAQAGGYWSYMAGVAAAEVNRLVAT